MADSRSRLPRSRRAVLALAAAALLVLDAGRSIYARIGYARPVEARRPAPYEGMK